MTFTAPLGFGIGLRPKHYRDFLETSPAVDFVEAISENFMGIGGRPRAVLEKVRQERPVVLHGVSLAVGSAAPLDERYLHEWKELIERIEPAVVSDHLCWGRAHGRYAHDLLPMPFTEEAVEHVVNRVGQVQDFLGRQIALENVSSYFTFAQSEMTEWEFLAQVAQQADCRILLDVNNIFVSSRNHGFDPDAFLAGLPLDRVVQIHLAGHQRRPELIIDTHDGPVSDEVWALYQRAIARFGSVPTLIEWDDAVPPLETVIAEAQKARGHAQRANLRSGGENEMPESRRPGAPIPSERRLEATQHTLFTAICDSEPVSSAAASLLVERAPLSNQARIEVYAEMYWLRVRDVLRDAFPSVRRTLGDETFDGVVADFLRAHPSAHPSLDRLGNPFAQFLREGRPALGDVAELEWARAESFVSANGPTVPWEELQTVEPSRWAELELRPHHSLRVLSLSSDPLPAFRGQTPEAGDVSPTWVAVWRQGFEVFHAKVSEAKGMALLRLKQGGPLPEILEPFGEDGPAALTALQSWFSEGMVSAIYVGSLSTGDERAD